MLQPRFVTVSAETTALSMLVLREILHAAGELGLARADLLEQAGLEPALLEHADARIDSSTFSRLCDVLLEASPDPALGLHWVERVMERAFGPVAHTLVYTNTLRQAFQTLQQLEGLIFDGPAPYTLIEGTSTFAVRAVSSHEGSERARVFADESLLTGFLKLVRVFFSTAKPRRVALAHAAPAYANQYVALFGPVVYFNQPCTEIELDRALLDARSPHADASMYAAHKALAEQCLLQRKHAAPYATRLRALLQQRMPARTTMDEAARALELSERSLRMKLAAEATSYREVELEVLGSFAQQLLRDPRRTIEQTAYEMGFCDAATFYRAFKRWTGTTPGAVRRRSV